MNISKQLEKEHSKVNSLKIANYILNRKEQFPVLIALLSDKQPLVAQRAGTVLSYLGEEQPEWLVPYVDDLCELLLQDVHVGIKRNIVRSFQFIPLNENYNGKLYTLCYNLLIQPKESIAVRAFCMTVLQRICELEPELSRELKITIEEVMKEKHPAFIARGRKIVRALNKFEN